ncbi:iron-containing alcohol dehydrogenase [Rhizorhabdus dicambivorans]|uniref:Alcohol dehydrogenase 2 n=1 Tax=Rhizorhabdus dicambivorans TaxID=1850238 RepID=A0A2A4FVR7_9SPHN|nr:iron-containing alcohol dehydrogenase [Rhizorhabdus dicambivorans]ATE67448.1 alcohol dehydrogenase [Rhizorhabdus dicambivorans]PCE41820.1 alcohol dehydrogenase [Rhizorhabdus dicambivorans]
MPAINLPRIIRVGGGALAELPEALHQCQLARPFIVTDPFMRDSGMLDRLLGVLAQAGIEPRCFTETEPDPTVALIDRALAALHEGEHDCVIGFGGGSPIDTAKAIAWRAVHPIPYAEMKAPTQNDRPGLTIVAVPTTAGTGSEATRFTIVTDEESDEKMLCIGLGFLPTIAIVDHELTHGKPRRLTADTGIDSLTHAIEAYVSRRANPFSDAMALSAMRLIAPNIRRVCADPGDCEARAAMMEGALHAGIAFSNASVGLVHGMSRPIGAFFHVPHGLSNAMLLPAVTAFSAPAALPRYTDCARAMGLADAEEGDQSAVAKLVEELAALNADLDVPTPAAYGIDPARWNERIPLMASQAIASGSPANNPRIADATEIEAIYASLWR